MSTLRLDPFAPLDHVARGFFGTPADRTPRFMPMDLAKSEAVSYTHLTLPTILRV